MLVRLVIALYVSMLSVVMVIPVGVAMVILMLVAYQAGSAATQQSSVGPLLLFLALGAGFAAWAVARLLSKFVDRSTEGQLGVEPTVIACALGIAAAFVMGNRSDTDLLPLLLLPPIAAFIGSFVPWRPQAPEVAGMAAGPLAIVAVLLAGMA
jgi:hypothetical protein